MPDQTTLAGALAKRYRETEDAAHQPPTAPPADPPAAAAPRPPAKTTEPLAQALAERYRAERKEQQQ